MISCNDRHIDREREQDKSKLIQISFEFEASVSHSIMSNTVHNNIY
jgi:hypothetical protein